MRLELYFLKKSLYNFHHDVTHGRDCRDSKAVHHCLADSLTYHESVSLSTLNLKTLRLSNQQNGHYSVFYFVNRHLNNA